MEGADALYVSLYTESGHEILDTNGLTILDILGRVITDGNAWESMESDVLTTVPVKIFQGQRSNNVADRVADSGTISFRLDNSSNNSAGLVGYYSPDHANVRDGFGIGSIVRVSLEKNGDLQHIAQGRIASIDISAGNLSEKYVDVVASDWLDIASRTTLPWMQLQTFASMKDDEVINTLMYEYIDDVPDSMALGTGSYTYPYPLNDIVDGQTTILTVLQKLVVNGLGRIFITGNTLSGEVLTYLSKTTLAAGGSATVSFSDDFEEIEITRQSYQRLRRVIVSTNGYRVGLSTYIHYLEKEVQIDAGETVSVIFNYKSDGTASGYDIPAYGAGATLSNISFTATSGSGANDLGAYLTIGTYLPGVWSYKVTLTNTSGVTGYLNKYEISGTPLLYNTKNNYEVVDSSVLDGFGITIDWVANYQNTYEIAKEIGDLLMSERGVDSANIKYLKFTPSATEDNYNKMIKGRPGAYASISDTVSGFSDNLLIVGIDLQIWNNGAYITEMMFFSSTI